jgi:predicted amidohydrolase
MTILTIAVAQYGLTDIESIDQFWDGLAERMEDAAKQHAELFVLPEYTTLHLLTLVPSMNYVEACEYLDSFSAAYEQFFTSYSKKLNMIILAGTHIHKGVEGYVNQAGLFFPDGRKETQNKIHLTPEEKTRWNLEAGDALNIIESEWGRLAILTCYDIEFPELSRIAADQGVELILCPSYTDTIAGYYRVQHSVHARAIENQLFVALSGIVGELEEQRLQIDKGHCRAGIFGPCDVPFPDDGVIHAGAVNEDMVIVTEIDFAMLRENRNYGIVAPFYDRRPDLYESERLAIAARHLADLKGE